MIILTFKIIIITTLESNLHQVIISMSFTRILPCRREIQGVIMQLRRIPIIIQMAQPLELMELESQRRVLIKTSSSSMIIIHVNQAKAIK